MVRSSQLMTSILDSLFKMPQGTGWLQVRPPSRLSARDCPHPVEEDVMLENEQYAFQAAFCYRDEKNPSRVFGSCALEVPNGQRHADSPLSRRAAGDGDPHAPPLPRQDPDLLSVRQAMCRDMDGRLHVIYMHRHTAIEHLVLELEE